MNTTQRGTGVNQTAKAAVASLDCAPAQSTLSRLAQLLPAPIAYYSRYLYLRQQPSMFWMASLHFARNSFTSTNRVNITT
jgi:hypothetical protein